jgi:tRNA (guanine37-N1)-methyltransferase
LPALFAKEEGKGPPLRVGVVTLFPELFTSFLAVGMVGRAVASGALAVKLVHLREFGLGKHRSVDDTPYGGGSGMVMRVDCIVNSLEAFDAAEAEEARAVASASAAGAAPENEAESRVTPPEAPPRAHRVLLTPQGARLSQAKVIELAARPRIALVCGRYEGFDERVRSFVDEEISLGDFVLTGGELAAMSIIDACSRMIPGVLGNAESATHESHSPAMDGLLEYPHYTRPVEYRGMRVPEVLQGGNHALIEAYRKDLAEKRTAERRPDLWQQAAARRRDRGAP